MKFVLGTKSERKKASVEKVLKQLLSSKEFGVINFAAKSLVPETPWDKETFDGAYNRAVDCLENCSPAEYFIGLESGLVERYGQIYEEAWACVISKDGKQYFGYSSGLKVPEIVTSKMKDLNLKHWQVMEILEKEHELSSDDTWGNYSKEMVVRDISLREALRNALVQIFCPQESLYYKK